MTYTLFIRQDCHDCRAVMDRMDELGTVYVVADIDEGPRHGAPRFYAAPALWDGQKLLAYGIDILAYLESTSR